MSDKPLTNSHCCCTGQAEDVDKAATDPTAANLLQPAPQAETTCPVMPGSTVIKAIAEQAGLFRDYRGRRYWFCCASCGPRFDRNPEKYANAV